MMSDLMAKGERWLINLAGKVQNVTDNEVADVFDDMDSVGPNDKVVGQVSEYLARFWVVTRNRGRSVDAKVELERVKFSKTGKEFPAEGLKIPTALRREIAEAKATKDLFSFLLSVELEIDTTCTILLCRDGFVIEVREEESDSIEDVYIPGSDCENN